MTADLKQKEALLERWIKAAGIGGAHDPNEFSSPGLDAVMTMPKKVLEKTLEDIVRRSPGGSSRISD